MKYRIEGNELIIKGLFSEKRYDFRELTKVSYAKELCVYKEDKCILKEKDVNKRVIYAMDILHLAVKNNLIVEDQEWFNDEIAVEDVYSYSMSIQEKIKAEYYDYVKRELGEEYELVISTDSTPYHVVVFVDIYRNGEKVYIKDQHEAVWFTYWLNGKMDLHLSFFELVMPTYIDVRTQDFRLTKLVDLHYDMEDIEDQIQSMKQSGVVTASSLIR